MYMYFRLYPLYFTLVFFKLLVTMCGWHGIKGALIDRSIDWLLFTAEIRVGYTPQSPVLWWWILLQLRIRRQNSQCGAVTIWDIEF